MLTDSAATMAGALTSEPAPQRIPVLDDEPSIVDAVATALRYERYDAEGAATGREAVSASGATRRR